jgi:site-specific recombinase XerD
VTKGKTPVLTAAEARELPDSIEQHPMRQQDSYRMIQRRAADAGIKTKIGHHTWRATSITAHLKDKGTLDTVQHIANHESPRLALARNCEA